MDVKALYPSIDVDFAVGKCIDLINESTVEFTNIDADELGLFLILTTDKDELEAKGLMTFCPTRITRKGRAPKLEASGINSKEDKRWAGWVKCEAKPNPFELKRLVTWLYETAYWSP
eukprot:gene18544-20405_t